MFYYIKYVLKYVVVFLFYAFYCFYVCNKILKGHPEILQLIYSTILFDYDCIYCLLLFLYFFLML